MVVLLEPPDPDGIAAFRQRCAVERIVMWGTIVLLFAATNVNLYAGILVPLWLGLSVATTAVVLGLALGIPVVALFGVFTYANRHGRAVLLATRERLEVRRTWRVWWFTLLAVAALALITACVLLDGPNNLGKGVLFLVIAISVALGNRWMDKDAPMWRLLLLGGWGALAALWMVVLVPVVGSDLAFMVGVGWIAAAPHVYLLLFLKMAIPRLVEHDGVVGKTARALGFLVPTQSESNERTPQETLARMKRRLAFPLRGRALGETLLEAGNALFALEDPRATGLFAAASRVLPADPRPFEGIGPGAPHRGPDAGGFVQGVC